MSDGKGAAAQAEVQEENQWQALLAKSARKGKEHDQRNSYLFVCGDKKAGKSSLLKKFRERVVAKAPKDGLMSPEYVLDYSFCAVKNVHDEPDEVHGHLNIWEMDQSDHVAHLLPVLLKPGNLKQVAYAICVDLSQPWAIMSSLTKWVEAISKAHTQLLSSLPADQQAQLKLKVSSYSQFYVDYSVKKASGGEASKEADISSSDIKVDTSIPHQNFGVPLVIVGCKSDLLASVFLQQQGVGDRFEYITRHLRKFALEYGATLLFSSSVGTGTNITALQEYVYHRLYDKFDLVHPSRAIGSDADFGIAVFAGYDSTDLIESVKPVKSSWAEKALFEEVFRAPNITKSTSTSKLESDVKAEDNDVFFKTLKFNVERGAPNRTQTRYKADVSAPPPTKQPSSPEPSPTPGPSSSPSADRKAPPAAAAAKAPATDQRAVKDFFRSLLSTSEKPGAAKSPDVRDQAKEALQQLKK